MSEAAESQWAGIVVILLLYVFIGAWQWLMGFRAGQRCERHRLTGRTE